MSMNETDKKVVEKYASELRSMDIPTPEISRALINTAMNRHVEDADFWNMGKHMQISMGLPIPPACEDEVVAGYWQWLRLQMPDTTSLFDGFKSLKPRSA